MTKVVFIAAAIQDVRIRDLIKAEPLRTKSQFVYANMPTVEACGEEWRTQVRDQIRHSDGVLAIISKNTSASSSQAWEIQCARKQGKPLQGIWAYKADPVSAAGFSTMVWTWGNIANWIDSL